MATIDERLDKIVLTLEQHGQNFEAIRQSFITIGEQSRENLRQINDNFATMKERMDQQTEAIDKLLATTTKLEAIAEVHDFRLRKLETNAPTAEIPKRKTGRG